MVMGFHGPLVLTAFLNLFFYLLNATTKFLPMNMKPNVKIKGYYVSQYYLEIKVSMYSPTKEMEGLFLDTVIY